MSRGPSTEPPTSPTCPELPAGALGPGQSCPLPCPHCPLEPPGVPIRTHLPHIPNNLRNLKKWKCCQSWVKGKVTGEGSSGSIQSPRKKQRKSFSCTNRAILSCINVKTDKASGIRVKLIKRAQLNLVKHF